MIFTTFRDAESCKNQLVGGNPPNPLNQAESELA